MTMSPFEVERQEFGRGPWGYRRGEVDRFLDEVQQTLVGLWHERATLREENERLNERVARFTALEDQLKNTLLLAQDSAERACEQARRESELIMREAGQKAREIVHTAHEERQRLEQSLRELNSTEQDSRQRLRTLAQAVLTQLDESEEAAADGITTLRALVAPGASKSTPSSHEAASAAERAAERMRRRMSGEHAGVNGARDGASPLARPTATRAVTEARAAELEVGPIMPPAALAVPGVAAKLQEAGVQPSTVIPGGETRPAERQTKAVRDNADGTPAEDAQRDGETAGV